MSRTYFISDTHFGHANILNFVDKNGNRIRPFASVEEHDQKIIENCDHINKNDILYNLGDVSMGKKNIKTMGWIYGRKVLLKGNHDVYGNSEYLKYFDRIEAYLVYPKHGLIFSHIPISSRSLKIGWINVHGHTHVNNVKIKKNRLLRKPIVFDDPRYLNICLEKTNFSPISFEDILEICYDRRKNLKQFNELWA